MYQTIRNKPSGYDYVETVEAVLDTEAKLSDIDLNFKTPWPKCLKLNMKWRPFNPVCIVKNGQDLLENLTRIKVDLEKHSVNYQMFVTRYYSGSKHHLNLIMSDGQCLFCSLTNDKDLDEQEVLHIETCVVHKLRLLNMTHGVFSCKLVRTLLGMKILSINACANAMQESLGVNLFKAELILNLPMIYVCQRI